MKLPQRVDKHITESSSIKIFSNSIPDNWIIREVTERDYGIDLYIELVTKNNEVTGDLISIQLKGKQNINWTKEDYYTYSAVKISTSNYWRRFPTPVFLCIVDVGEEEVFFCPVKTYIKRNFLSYIKQSKFSYRIERSNKLDKSSLKNFLFSYFEEKFIKESENHITTFVSHYSDYQLFFGNNQGRDQFMGVETDRVLYLEHCYSNYEFLCRYFEIEWTIKPLMKIYKESQEMFGNDYRIYELHIDEVVTELEKMSISILMHIRELITEEEREYWMIKNIQLFNYMLNVKDDGSVPSW